MSNKNLHIAILSLSEELLEVGETIEELQNKIKELQASAQIYRIKIDCLEYNNIKLKMDLFEKCKGNEKMTAEFFDKYGPIKGERAEFFDE